LGDWLGLGRKQVGIWRPGVNAQFMIKDMVTNQTSSFNIGSTVTKDVPVVGDFLGKGYDQIVVFSLASKAENWKIYDQRTNHILTLKFPATSQGGDIPCEGDFSGSGKSDLAVWRQATGTFHVKHSLSGQETMTKLGEGGDVPVAACQVVKRMKFLGLLS
jgi:hypothetical protein